MGRFFNSYTRWNSLQQLSNKTFVCGFCNHNVSSDTGYGLTDGRFLNDGLYICPNCDGPNFIPPEGKRYPSPAFGNSVAHVPEMLNALYEEARRCSSQGCFTGSVLLCRKMLMNIAVQQGATEGLSFIRYVNHLSDKGFVPQNAKQWIDHIRIKGNEATHEVAVMGEQDAKILLIFVEMLLKFIYEFPQMIPSST